MLVDGVSNPWNDARISTVPLDFAVTLTTKSTYNARQMGGNYYQVAPSSRDVDDALEIIGKDDLAEGKVPLFYYENFGILVNGEARKPLYFRKSDLEREFKRYQPRDALPKTSVTELFAVLVKMVEPEGMDPELKSLVFVAPKGSDIKAKECTKKGGDNPPFLFGKRNIVL
jgi:hypothetical protein